MRRALWLLPVLGACSAPQDAQLWLIDSLSLTSQPKPGFVSGFNLDGVVSPEDDAASCGHGDLIGLDGTPGVDNAFSTLMPAMEVVAGDAVAGLVQAAIDDGDLLVTIEVDAGEDANTMEVGRAVGPALVGADGRLVAGQTLDVDTELPSSSTEEISFAGPLTRGHGLELDLPLSVLGYALDFTLHDAIVEIDVEEGHAEGRLAGLISLDQMDPTLDFVNSNGDPQIAEPVRSALEANADVDLDDDGDCRYISFTVHYTAIPAWLFTEAP
ncbi:MAG: hypothetical protein KC912_08710 [Proteobacteria bacterium]|nr:hypothetical protein [Pseudomonadota bacterium]